MSRRVRQHPESSTQSHILRHVAINLGLFLLARPLLGLVTAKIPPDLPRALLIIFVLAGVTLIGFEALLRTVKEPARFLLIAVFSLLCACLGGFVGANFSIIGYVWGGIISACGVCVAAVSPYIEVLHDHSQSLEHERRTQVLTATHFVVERTIASLLAIAAIGAVAASILFKNGWNNADTKMDAAWMAIGMGLLSLLCLRWVLIPLGRSLERLMG